MVVSQASRDVEGLLAAPPLHPQAGFDLVLGRVLSQSPGKDASTAGGGGDSTAGRASRPAGRGRRAGSCGRLHQQRPRRRPGQAGRPPGRGAGAGRRHRRAGGGPLRRRHSSRTRCPATSPCTSAAATAAGDAIVVPFGGNEHDWAALELAALISRVEDAPLLHRRLRRRRTRRAGRQPVAGVGRPHPAAHERHRRRAGAGRAGSEGVVDLAARARTFVIGLSPRFRETGLGETRTEIAARVAVPALFVRRGTRPGVLAPGRSVTRFSWSLSTRPG